MKFLLELLFIAAASTTFQRIGKYIDFRLGPQKVSTIKKERRFEKYWIAVAKQSPRRFAFRVLSVVENMFCNMFGPKLGSWYGTIRFLFFSLCLNLILAFSAIVLSVPDGALSFYLKDSELLAMVLLMVVVNIPLDYVAYLSARVAIRTAMSKPLWRVTGLAVCALVASYIMVALSTVIGAVLSLVALTNGKLSLSVLWSLVLHWLPLGFRDPLTSQANLNGVNAGYLALGALPSIFLLCATLMFMLFLQTIARWVHYEFCVTAGRILDDKKSFFELIALAISAFLFVLWGVLWALDYSITLAFS